MEWENSCFKQNIEFDIYMYIRVWYIYRESLIYMYIYIK